MQCERIVFLVSRMLPFSLLSLFLFLLSLSLSLSFLSLSLFPSLPLSTHSQLQESSEREKINDKYPSFELVLNFVRTDSLTQEQVSSILEQRSDMASSVARGYSYCADIVRALGMENLFEVCMLSFNYGRATIE